MKRKKLYYVPGLISLVILPVLLLFLDPGEKKQLTRILFYVPKDNISEPGEISFSKYWIYGQVKNKKVITVYLWEYDFKGDLFYDKKARVIQREFERMAVLHDTTMVLKVDLGDENTYQDFVWLVNQAIVFGIKRYAYVDNCFIFFPNEPPRPPDLSLLEIINPNPIVVHDSDDHYEEPTVWEISKWQIEMELEEAILAIKHNRLVVTAFVLLIVFPGIFRIVGLKKQLYRRKQV